MKKTNTTPSDILYWFSRMNDNPSGSLKEFQDQPVFIQKLLANQKDGAGCSLAQQSVKTFQPEWFLHLCGIASISKDDRGKINRVKENLWSLYFKGTTGWPDTQKKPFAQKNEFSFATLLKGVAKIGPAFWSQPCFGEHEGGGKFELTEKDTIDLLNPHILAGPLITRKAKKENIWEQFVCFLKENQEHNQVVLEGYGSIVVYTLLMHQHFFLIDDLATLGWDAADLISDLNPSQHPFHNLLLAVVPGWSKLQYSTKKGELDNYQKRFYLDKCHLQEIEQTIWFQDFCERFGDTPVFNTWDTPEKSELYLATLSHEPFLIDKAIAWGADPLKSINVTKGRITLMEIMENEAKRADKIPDGFSYLKARLSQQQLLMQLVGRPNGTRDADKERERRKI